MIYSFAVMLATYTFIMLVGNLRLELDDTRQTGLHVRTLIAVHQVLVITMIFSMHSIFVFFVRVLKKDTVGFVLVSYSKERPLDVREHTTGYTAEQTAEHKAEHTTEHTAEHTAEHKADNMEEHSVRSTQRFSEAQDYEAKSTHTHFFWDEKSIFGLHRARLRRYVHAITTAS
jgi:hypothetical protein